MGKQRKSILIAAAIAVTASPAAAGSLEKNRTRMEKLTPAHFAANVQVIDDPMQRFVMFTTKKVYRTKGGGGGMLNESDTWVNASVDKNTGATIYRLLGYTNYWGNWRFYSVGTYWGVDGPVQGLLTATRNVDACMSMCRFSETVYMDVDEAVMRHAAALPNMWAVRFSANDGSRWDEEISPVEVAALVNRVNDYKALRGFQ